MTYERILAGEALKRFYDGRLTNNDDGAYHIFRCDGSKYNEGRDPLDYKWQVTVFGAIFLMHIKLTNVITEDDSGGNFWSNSLVEKTIMALPDFQTRTRVVGRIRAIYGWQDDSELSPYDMEFKRNCKNRTKNLLIGLATGDCLGVLNWEKRCQNI